MRLERHPSHDLQMDGLCHSQLPFAVYSVALA